MRIQNLTIPEALLSLHSRMEGLSDHEAESRLTEYGFNRIKPTPKTSLLLRFGQELIHFFAVILWIAAVLCFALSALFNQPEMEKLAFAVIGVILVNALFSFWQFVKAERALEALEKLLPQSSSVLRAGRWSTISSEKLVPGDIVEIREGDNVGADIRLIEAYSLRIDTSHVTGESIPAHRNHSPDSAEEIIWAKNLVLRGTRVVSGRALGVVFATGERTEFGRIAGLTLAAERPRAPIEVEITRISRWIALLATLSGLICFLIGLIWGLPLATALLFGIGFIVANVPEGLLPTLTLSLALSAQRLSRRHALIRRLTALETLGATSVICTDKTGTLTLNKLQVQQLNCLGESNMAQIWLNSADLNLSQLIFLHAILVTHSLPKNEVTPSTPGDPIELALVRFAQSFKLLLSEGEKLGEIPFDDRRRRQSVAVRSAERIWLITKGAPEVILNLCTSKIIGSEKSEASSEFKEQQLKSISESAQRGLKVIAYARRPLDRFSEKPNSDSKDSGTPFDETLENNLEFLGWVALEDPLRPEIANAVSACKKAGIRVVMITGDHPETARSVALEAGIFHSPQARVVLGGELDHWSDTQLQLALSNPEIAFARVRANQKLRIVSAFMEKKDIVAVTGDGVNDAPALRKADVGVAMGACGTDVARESADVILLDDNFASIVCAIEEGRSAFGNMRNFITYILSSNVPEGIPFILYMILPIPLPLTVLQILSIDLGTDLLPAIGLGTELPSSLQMTKPPRSRGEALMSGGLLLRAYAWLGLWQAVAAMTSFFVTLKLGGWTWGDALSNQSPLSKQAATATLTSIVMMQMVNVFLCRSARAKSSWRTGKNWLIITGVLFEILFVISILYWPPMKSLLATEAFPWQVFFLILSFMIGFYGCEKIRIKFADPLQEMLR